jgi:hypothetical protein
MAAVDAPLPHVNHIQFTLRLPISGQMYRTIADRERDVGGARLRDATNLNTFPRKLLAELDWLIK